MHAQRLYDSALHRCASLHFFPSPSPDAMLTLSAQLLNVADLVVVGSVTRNIAESIELPAAERDALIVDAETLCVQITDLAHALHEDEDEHDLYTSLAALWLELRFVWQRHNLVANYNTMRAGTCAPIVLARASVASFVLQRIEQLLDRQHLDKLGDSAVQLLDTVREDVERGNLHVVG
jgi:hypothetical protein